MKKCLVLLLLCIPVYVLAKPAVGLNVSAGYVYEHGTNQYDINLGPSLHLLLTPKIELAPAILFGYSGISYSDNQEYKYSQMSLGASVGLYYHLFSNDYFGFSFGPDICGRHYFAPKSEVGGTSKSPKDYDKNKISLGMPLNFDLKFGSKATLRLSCKVISVDGSFSEHLDFSAQLKSLPAPSFNLLYTF